MRVPSSDSAISHSVDTCFCAISHSTYIEPGVGSPVKRGGLSRRLGGGDEEHRQEASTREHQKDPDLQLRILLVFSLSASHRKVGFHCNCSIRHGAFSKASVPTYPSSGWRFARDQ